MSQKQTDILHHSQRKGSSAQRASWRSRTEETCQTSNRPDPANEPLWRRSYRATRRLLLRFRKPWIERRLRNETVEEVDGVRVVVAQGVHNPVVFRAGVFLARAVDKLDTRGHVDILDMGTGSGIAAIFAARRGFSVSAVDVNPSAVRCARANIERNGIENFAVYEGDLFAPVSDRTFDVVLFNPPFFSGKPRDVADMAWRSVDTLERFANQLPGFLKDGGRALVVFSSDGDQEALQNAFSAPHWDINVFDWLDFGNEVLTIYSLTYTGTP